MRSDNETERILKAARDRFDVADKSEIEIRKEARIDLEFVAGIQWNAKARRAREEDDRPVITVNKLPEFVQQIANNARLNKPSIKITRGDNQASKDTADVYEGLVRKIQYESGSEQAWDSALENAANCSFGAVRITPKTVYRSFHQELIIEAIPDPMSVLFSPGAMQYDRSDGEFAFVKSIISRDEFKRLYPKAKLIEAGWYEKNNPAPGWVNVGEGGKFLMRAEYWDVEKFDRNLVGLVNGENKFEDELTAAEHQMIARGEDGRFLEARQEDQRIHQYMTNGVEILSEMAWPGRWIPLIPVFGKEMWVNGKRMLFSVVRFQRDPQQLYNFYATTEAEMISDAPKTPWIGFVGQFKTKLQDWMSANLKKFAFLEADAVPMPGGAPSPLPQRNVSEPPVQALIAGKMQASDEMKAAASMFDPSLGMQRNDQSGIAIQQLRSEGDIANYHFIDNLARSQWHAGRILCDLIPHYYDPERDLEILGKDMTAQIVRVNTNEPVTDPKTNRTYHHKMDEGRYDVKVSVQPSFATKREENFDMLMNLSKGNPQIFPLIADVIFKYSDFEGADILVERFKSLLPPALQQGANDQQIPPAIQAHIQQLTQQLQQAQEDLKGKLSQEAMRADLDWKIQTLGAYVKIRVAEITASKDRDNAEANLEAERLEGMFDRAHDVALAAHAQAIAPPPATPGVEPGAPPVAPAPPLA